VVEREKALVGLLITLNPASSAAEKEAVSAGFVAFRRARREDTEKQSELD
jgi:hypothetical protein